MISGIARPSKMLGLFTIGKGWDPSILITYATVIVLSIFTFRHLYMYRGHPKLAERYEDVVTRTPGNIALGAALFGAGLGLSGIDQGPALINFFALNSIVYWMIGCVAG